MSGKERGITNNLRDKHFKNYAKLVFDEVEVLFMKLARATDEAEKAQITSDIQLCMARRMFDLACHTADEIAGGSEPNYAVLDVSDYPELPTRQKAEEP